MTKKLNLIEVIMHLFREIFLSFIRVHLLYHASKERIYGLEMIKELTHHGYDISPGTLYPIFHGLEKAGYLESEREVVGGKVRKYYRITPAGQEMLLQLQNKIAELSNEILEKSRERLVTFNYSKPNTSQSQQS